jgi:hypothetical protein
MVSLSPTMVVTRYSNIGRIFLLQADYGRTVCQPLSDPHGPAHLSMSFGFSRLSLRTVVFMQ